jgi:hypothetical protein
MIEIFFSILFPFLSYFIAIKMEQQYIHIDIHNYTAEDLHPLRGDNGCARALCNGCARALC